MRSDARTFVSAILCVAGFVFTGVMIILAGVHASHGKPSAHGSTFWLLQHNPRHMHHDAELLRRQRLAQLTELSPRELGEHVPAILASLDHSDYHVRRLAGSMLFRLEARAINQHAASIIERLDHHDATVRLYSMQALALADSNILSTHASILADCINDVDPGVRWATVDTLARLNSTMLAQHAISAIDALVRAEDYSLAKSAVSSWSPKLEEEPDVIAAFGKWSFEVNFGAMNMASATAMGGTGSAM